MKTFHLIILKIFLFCWSLWYITLHIIQNPIYWKNTKMTDYIAYAYAITVAVGGIVGYIKKGSMMSAIMVSSINFYCIQSYQICSSKILRWIFCKMSNCSIFLGPRLWWLDWLWSSSNISKSVQLPFIDVSSRNFSRHNGQKMGVGWSIYAGRVSCGNFNINVYKICPSLGGNQQLRSGVFRRVERKR